MYKLYVSNEWSYWFLGCAGSWSSRHFVTHLIHPFLLVDVFLSLKNRWSCHETAQNKMADSKKEAKFKSFLVASKPCGLEMKFLHATAPRSPIDMYTADACVATEKHSLEARNCGIGQKLDYALKVLHTAAHKHHIDAKLSADTRST